MPQEHFQDVRLMLGGTLPLRNDIRGPLQELGFCNMSLANDSSYVRDAIRRDRADVIIIDDGLPGEDVCDIVRDARHMRLGHNPFIVVLFSTRAEHPHLIEKFVNCGADDVMLKPLTAATVKQRMADLRDHRKKFVVTCDYIGPDRRMGPRPGLNEIPEIEVPNPLQAKLLGGTVGARLALDIEHTAMVVTRQKIERNLFQISWLVSQLIPMCSGHFPKSKTTQYLDLLYWVMEDVAVRLNDAERRMIGESCRSIHALVQHLRQSPELPDSESLHLLQNLARTVNTEFSESDPISLDTELA